MFRGSDAAWRNPRDFVNSVDEHDHVFHCVACLGYNIVCKSRAVRPAKRAEPVSQKNNSNQWHGPSNITTYVRCLRLLDLDRLPDWPGITENTFTSKSAQQNLQARIKAVEWSLYRLFEIYDAKETQTKLGPFFPPLAPLQSLNLRAALYRFLTELKKNGVLGREALLRKTMLDECKGEKFEEIICTLALLVLRKACRIRHPEVDFDKIEDIPKEHLVPLIIAYRQCLQRNLQDRRALYQHADDDSTKLASAQADLQNRSEAAERKFQPIEEKDLRHLSDFVQANWLGDDRWLDALLQGRTQSSRLPSLQFDLIGPAVQKGSSKINSNDLAAELEERIGEQRNRLMKWKTFHASMKNRKEANLSPSKSHEPSWIQPTLRFDQHQAIRLNSVPTQPVADESLDPYHANILINLDEELELVDSIAPVAEILDRKRNDQQALLSETDDSSDLPNPLHGHHTTGRDEVSDPAISHKEENLGNSPLQRNSSPEAGVGEYIPEEQTDSARLAEEKWLVTEDFHPHEDADDIPSSPHIGLHAEDHTTSSLESSEQDKALGQVYPRGGPTSTLLERTRASLLPFTMRLSSPEAEDETSVNDADELDQTLHELPAIDTRRGNLLERTRQSMSLLPNLASTSKTGRRTSAKQPRFSEIFPVNQFETPGKQQARGSGAWSPRSGSSTPRDKLFSEEADYASVFKSRPRIAVSPSLTPDRSNLGLESMLGHEEDDLELEDTEDTPIRGVRGIR